MPDSSGSLRGLGQLIYEENFITGECCAYEYDNAGNIVLRIDGMECDEYEYVYAPSPFGDRLVSYNGEIISYDSSGRTVVYRGKQITYLQAAVNKIASIGNISFTYDADGMRRSKTVNGVTHYYTYDGIQLVKEEWGNNVMIFLYDATGSPVGMQYRNSTYAEGDWDIYYYEKNLQGDIVAVYNSFGTKLVTYEYDAWGDISYVTYSNGGASTSVVHNPLRYRGYYYDDDLDLYYLATRYYDPEVCRFITADHPAYLGANGDLVSYNLYAYCSNNPVMFVDPTGHMPEWMKWTVIGTAAVGLVVATVLTFGVAGTGAAVVGAAVLTGGVVSGGINAADQLHDTGEIDLTEVAIATLSGETYGLVIGLAGGSGGFAVAGKLAVASGASLLNSWNDDATFDETIKSLGISLLVSGAAQGAGYLAGRYGPEILSRLIPKNPNDLLTIGDIVSVLWGLPAVKTGVIRFASGVASAILNN